MSDRAGQGAMGGLFSLATYWFLLMGGIAMFFPFFTLYLKENAALRGTEVGIVVAILPLVGVFAQPFWGIVADRSGSRTRILSFLSLGTALGYFVLGNVESFPAILLATALLGFFSTATMPLAVSVSLAVLRELGPRAFGWVRTFGTLGFGCFVISFPFALDGFQADQGLLRYAGGPSEPGLQVMFLGATAIVLLATLVSLAIPKIGGAGLRAEPGAWRRMLRHRPYRGLLLLVFLAWLFLDGPMLLFPAFVRSRGGDLNAVSNMWILMLSLEVPLVAASGWIVRRLGERGFMALGLCAGALRWTLCGLSDELWILYALSILHGVTVAGLIVGAPYYVEACVPESLRSSGQGLLGMMGISLGGILSRLLAGWLFENLGPGAPYLLGGLGGIALLCAMAWILPPARPPDPEASAC